MPTTPPARISPAASAAAGIGIEIRGLSRTFAGNVQVLSKLDLSVSAGEFLAILGPSGCGKSTLLRLIAGLDRPDSGSVRLLGDAASAAGAGQLPVAYVFQDAHLLPWRSVMHNVALPLELMGQAKAARLQAAAAAIAKVGLIDAMRRYPSQLSGGMRMRVSLARALVTRPRLLLLDEPFAALDEITRQRLDEDLRQLWMDSGMTVLFVTHSTPEATFLAQRAVVFSGRPARLLADMSIHLPPWRDAALRGTSQFAAASEGIYRALRQSQS